MKFYKTVVTVEVLTDEPDVDLTNLGDLHYYIMEGSGSGHIDQSPFQELTKEELVAECAKHNTDPEFFLWDKAASWYARNEDES